MYKYIIVVAVGACSYGALASFAKLAYAQGYSAGEITLAQALIGAIVLWSASFVQQFKNKEQDRKENIKLLLAGTSMGASAYTYYLSIEYIPASLSIVLLMQMTWMSILIDYLFFKVKISLKQILASVFIIAGSILAGNLINLNNINLSFVGISLGMSAALIYSVYVIFTTKLGKNVSMFKKSALMTTGSAMMIFLINAKSIVTSKHLDFGLLKWGLMLAFFGTIIPPLCFSKGMPKIGAGLSSILLTLELPCVILCAYLILGEQVSFLQIMGICIMLTAIIILNLSKQKEIT